VVLGGARQTGKTTLSQRLVPGDRACFSFDDLDVVAAAQRNPKGFLSARQEITLDEVQRYPDILLAVKREVDESQAPGRFLLTGSANLLLMRRVSETLAGRASYLTLWPMTRREQRGLGSCGLWSALLEDPEARWAELLASRRSGGRPRHPAGAGSTALSAPISSVLAASSPAPPRSPTSTCWLGATPISGGRRSSTGAPRPGPKWTSSSPPETGFCRSKSRRPAPRGFGMPAT